MNHGSYYLAKITMTGTPEIPLQHDMFSGALADNRNRRRKALEGTSVKTTVAFGQNARFLPYGLGLALRKAGYRLTESRLFNIRTGKRWLHRQVICSTRRNNRATRKFARIG